MTQDGWHWQWACYVVQLLMNAFIDCADGTRVKERLSMLLPVFVGVAIIPGAHGWSHTANMTGSVVL